MMSSRYQCAEAEYTWLIQNGEDTGINRGNRSMARLNMGNRVGALEDADEAIKKPAEFLYEQMFRYRNRGEIKSDLVRVRLIGFRAAREGAVPPLDVEGAIVDLSTCISIVRGEPSNNELSALIHCFKDRRDLIPMSPPAFRDRKGLDYASDDAAFKRLACRQCWSGTQCDTTSGCDLNLH